MIVDIKVENKEGKDVWMRSSFVANFKGNSNVYIDADKVSENYMESMLYLGFVGFDIVEMKKIGCYREVSNG